jgi:hypothetical protein
MDELSLYNRALSANEIAAVFAAGSAGKCYIPTPPTITAQPAGQSFPVDSTAMLQVSVSGTAPLSFQWSCNGTNIDGATNASLALSNVQPSQAGNYSVSVTNLYGSTNSAIAVLNVYGLPPYLFAQPASTTAMAGGSAAFTAGATGTLPLSFQWSFNGTNLDGATNATLILTAVQFSQAGSYAAQIANAFGATNTAAAILSVIPPPACAPAPAGIVGWWAGESSGLDSVANNNANLENGTGFTNGEVGTAFYFNGNNNFAIANPSAPGNLDVGQGSGLTIECWIKPTTISSAMGMLTVFENQLGAWNGYNPGVQFLINGIPNEGLYPGCLGVNLVDSTGGSHTFGTVPNVLTAGVWQHVALTYDKTAGVAALYTNGVVAAQANLGVFTPQTSFTNLDIGGQTTYASVSNPANPYFGALDELSLYNRALSSNEIAAIFVAGSAGKCPSAPVITETIISLGSTSAMSGTTITVPVMMNALGIESGFIGSVAFDPAKLTLLSVQGAAANLTQVNSGLVGIAAFPTTSATFAAGSNTVAQLIFATLPVTNSTAVNLTFGNTPIYCQLTDDNFDNLPALYQSGVVQLTPAEYCGDVWPRFNGDHQLTLQDWVEVGRLVAGLDVPTNSDEFLRADCAPRGTPDGMLTVADWVQAGRYVMGLDPITLVTPAPTSHGAAKAKPMGGQAPTRVLQVATVAAQRSQTVSVPVSLVCLTNENAVGLTLNYNPNQLRLLSVSLGSALNGGRWNLNSNQLGKVGLTLAVAPGNALAAGTNLLAVLKFAVSASASGTVPLTLDDSVVTLETADLRAAPLGTSYVNGAITLPPQPTLAGTVSGGELQFGWSLASGTFQVQTASQPGGPWTTLVLPLVTNGANVNCVLPSTNQQQFFRLQGQ